MSATNHVNDGDPEKNACGVGIVNNSDNSLVELLEEKFGQLNQNVSRLSQ